MAYSSQALPPVSRREVLKGTAGAVAASIIGAPRAAPPTRRSR